MTTIPEFTEKSELFKWLKENKHLLITEKKSQIKHADPVSIMVVPGVTNKANPELLNLSEINVKVAINTTSIRDSHKDVHIPGIWKKSLSENKLIYHLQEHQMKFDRIISDRVTAYTKTMTWLELGFSYPGNTEVLIFDSAIEKEQNAFMFEQYAKGRVKNHSVGMQYVKVEMAINSESKFDVDEKAVWDKYINQVANKEEVEEDGYFFAVTEAKVIEGSAVVLGSNRATPTISAGKALESADDVTDPQPLVTDNLINAIKQLAK